MRIHPRLVTLIHMVIFIPLFVLFKKLLKWGLVVDIIIIAINCTVSTIIYHYLVKKYDDEDMII
jgi:Na+-driven multidrug efflux pump